MKLFNLNITRVAHDTFRIAGSKVVYTDPYKVKERDKADLVLISHEHFDHLSHDDLEKVCTERTKIIASSLCKAGLSGLKVAETQFVEPGTKISVEGIAIEAVPAYNVNKFKAPGQAFHPKGEARVGFLVRIDGTTVYFAADTDFIPEMRTIKCDIALLPVSGTYVMTADEAAKAAMALNPKIAVPMHYGAIVGSEDDAKKFKALVKNCQVEIL